MDDIKSLHDFIEKEYKLITVLGVFGAISAFSVNLELYLLTFSSLAIFLLLAFELFRNIPSIDDESPYISALKMFEILIFCGFIISVYFYIAKMAFVEHTGLKITFIIFFVVTPYFAFIYTIITNWAKNEEIQEIINSPRKYQKIFWITVILLSIIIFCELTYLTVKFFEIVPYG